MVSLGYKAPVSKQINKTKTEERIIGECGGLKENGPHRILGPQFELFEKD